MGSACIGDSLYPILHLLGVRCEIGRGGSFRFSCGIDIGFQFGHFIYFASAIPLSLVAIAMFVSCCSVASFAPKCESGPDWFGTMAGFITALVFFVFEWLVMFFELPSTVDLFVILRLAVVTIIAIAGALLSCEYMQRCILSFEKSKGEGPRRRFLLPFAYWTSFLVLPFSLLLLFFVLMFFLSMLDASGFVLALLAGACTFIASMFISNRICKFGRVGDPESLFGSNAVFALVSIVFVAAALCLFVYWQSRSGDISSIVVGSEIVCVDDAGDAKAVVGWRGEEVAMVKPCVPLGEGEYLIDRDSSVEFISVSDMLSIIEVEKIQVE